MKIRYEEGVDLKNQYVIISNHFSYIDIPALAALNIPFRFIGKMQVNNIPVLGYIFKNLHIMVDMTGQWLINTIQKCFIMERNF